MNVIIEKLINDTNDIYLYGAGSLAIDIYNYLKKNNIMVKGIVVDIFFYKQEMKFLDNIKIFIIDELKNKRNISIVAGNANYCHIKDKCLELGIESVYYLVPIGYGKIGNNIPKAIIQKYDEKIEELKELLADDISRHNLDRFLSAMVSGDALEIIDNYYQADYFDNDVYQLNNEEVYCDIGVYDGNTLKSFSESTKGNYEQIYAFEANDECNEQIDMMIKKYNIQKINLYNICLWNSNNEIVFGHDDISSEEENKVGRIGKKMKSYALDSVLFNRRKISLIKINFPGAIEVLKGASDIIKKDIPKIACTVGFDLDELIEIPKLIKMLNNNYKLYLRYRLPLTDGLVLYAVEK